MLYIWLYVEDVESQLYPKGTLVRLKNFKEEESDPTWVHCIPYTPKLGEVPPDFLRVVEEEGEGYVELKVAIKVTNIRGIENEDYQTWWPSKSKPTRFDEFIVYKSQSYEILK